MNPVRACFHELKTFLMGNTTTITMNVMRFVADWNIFSEISLDFGTEC